MRPARRTVSGGSHVRAGHRRLRGPARGVPPARHAAGRPELLRRGRARHRPGRHVRRPAPAARRGRAGHAVRRTGLRHGRPAVPARHRDLLVRVGRQQARRVEQRHADVVGTRRRHQARRAVHRVVRQPAQVRPDRPSDERQHARPGRRSGALRGKRRGKGRWVGDGGFAHRGGGHAAGEPGGPVRTGRGHHHARLRGPGGDHRAARQPAGPGGPYGRHRVQRRQCRSACRGRLHRPRADRAPPARPDHPAAPHARAGHRRDRRPGRLPRPRSQPRTSGSVSSWSRRTTRWTR